LHGADYSNPICDTNGFIFCRGTLFLLCGISSVVMSYSTSGTPPSFHSSESVSHSLAPDSSLPLISAFHHSPAPCSLAFFLFLLHRHGSAGIIARVRASRAHAQCVCMHTHVHTRQVFPGDVGIRNALRRCQQTHLRVHILPIPVTSISCTCDTVINGIVANTHL